MAGHSRPPAAKYLRMSKEQEQFPANQADAIQHYKEQQRFGIVHTLVSRPAYRPHRRFRLSLRLPVQPVRWDDGGEQFTKLEGTSILGSISAQAYFGKRYTIPLEGLERYSLSFR